MSTSSSSSSSSNQQIPDKTYVRAHLFSEWFLSFCHSVCFICFWASVFVWTHDKRSRVRGMYLDYNTQTNQQGDMQATCSFSACGFVWLRFSATEMPLLGKYVCVIDGIVFPHETLSFKRCTLSECVCLLYIYIWLSDSYTTMLVIAKERIENISAANGYR